MGFFNWLSNITKSKEFKQGIKEGEKELKAAEKKERENALTKSQFKAEMAKGQRELASRSGDASHLKTESDRYHKELAQRKPAADASKFSAKERGWFRQKVVSEAEKETKLAKQIEKTGVVMKTDVFERQAESISRIISRASKNIKEAESTSLQLNNQMMAQDAEVERLLAALKAKASISKNEARSLEEEQQLMSQIIQNNQEIITRINNIRNLTGDSEGLFKARKGVMSNADFIIQLLATCEVDAKEMAKRIKDEIKYAEKVMGYQKSVHAAMDSFERSEKLETDKIVEFISALKKTQKKAA